MAQRLTYAQLEGVWIKAASARLGRAKATALAPLMAAIAEAESGGNPDALNPNDNGGTQSSFGLWQISNGTHVPPAPTWADPATNASLAVGKYLGQGLSAWGTYDSGAYKAYLSGKTTPDLNVSGNPGATQAELTASFDVSTQCAWGLNLPYGGGFLGLTSGSTLCLLSKTQARALVGAGLLVTGGVIGLFVLARLGAAEAYVATREYVTVLPPVTPPAGQRGGAQKSQAGG